MNKYGKYISRCYTSPKAIELFQKFFYICFYHVTLFQDYYFICFAWTWKIDFAVNLVTSFSCQKPLKSKNKKHGIFWNTEFYHPAKFELKRRKNGKVIPRMRILHPICPQWKLSNLTLLIRAIPTLWIEPLLLSFFNQHVGWDMISHKSSSPTFSTRVTTMYSSCVM